MKHSRCISCHENILNQPDVFPSFNFLEIQPKCFFLSFPQCYIQYMNFARRAEGIKPARAVFKMAREDKRSSYHVYVAAALMEFYCSKVTAINYVQYLHRVIRTLHCQVF